VTTYLVGQRASRSRAVTAVSAPGGIVIPSWQSLVVNASTSDAAGIVSVTTPFGESPPLDGLGFCGAAVATDGTVWLLSHSGYLMASTPGSGVPDFSASSPMRLPAGETYLGLVVIGLLPYAVASSGRVFTVTETAPPPDGGALSDQFSGEFLGG
jgi:hypothetical protein